MSGRRPRRAMGSSEPEVLLASTGFLLARLGTESRRRFAGALKGSPVAVSHYGLLVTLAARGPVSQRELAAHTVIDPRNLVVLLDELEAEGLIERAALRDDRRVRSVSLSAKGRKVLRRLRSAGVWAEHDLLSALSPAERKTLHALLLKLFNHVFEEDA